MARPIWTGSISFGLVNIPVQLYPATATRELSFKMLDKRDFAPIHEKRVNELSGREVPWDNVVKGFKYGEDQFVVLTEDEIRAAYPKTTQTIELLAFVNADEIEPVYFEKPYYAEPLPNSHKAYLILVETLANTNRIGVARIVLRTRAHLTALIPRNNMLIAVFLRFAHDLKDVKDLGVPRMDNAQLGITGKELDMAKQLVDSMTEDWDPKRYKDDYHDDLMRLIRHKAKVGQIEVVEKAPEQAAEGEVIDIADLLRRSMKRAKAKV